MRLLDFWEAVPQESPVMDLREDGDTAPLPLFEAERLLQIPLYNDNRLLALLLKKERKNSTKKS